MDLLPLCYLRLLLFSCRLSFLRTTRAEGSELRVEGFGGIFASLSDVVPRCAKTLPGVCASTWAGRSSDSARTGSGCGLRFRSAYTVVLDFCTSGFWLLSSKLLDHCDLRFAPCGGVPHLRAKFDGFARRDVEDCRRFQSQVMRFTYF
jgi:hypothetical protein